MDRLIPENEVTLLRFHTYFNTRVSKGGMMEETKVCSKCGVEKPLVEFGKRKTSKDGRRGECKECNNAYHKYRSENGDIIQQLKIDKIKDAENAKTKICSKCGIEKELVEFQKEKNGKYGVRGDCKECNKIKSKKIPYRK